MGLQDWLWLIKLIIEILKVIAQLPADELRAIANLRQITEPQSSRPRRARKPPEPETDQTVT